MGLTSQQQEALRVFHEVKDSHAPLTAGQVAALQHLTQEVIDHEQVERLKQFARDTARINPRLLSDVESGLVRPCADLTRLMDSFYGVQA